MSCRSSRSSSSSFAIEDVIRLTSRAARVPASARHLFHEQHRHPGVDDPLVVDADR
jgi:hypothetical protein